MRARAFRARKYPRVYADRPLAFPGMENACEGALERQPAASGEKPTVADRKEAQGECRFG